MDSALELLQHFSLSPQEAELYLLLLKQGSSNVTNLAHFQKKNRAAVYFHLKHLLERGLVQESRIGRRASYVALPPKKLAALLDRWTTDFKTLLPELESLQRSEQSKPVMEVIESVAGFKRIYDEITSLPVGAEFLVLEGKVALQGELHLLNHTEWSAFFQKIVDRRILTRAVFTKESMELPHASLSEANKRILRSRLWDLRSLPESAMPLDHLVMIYGHKAAFFIPLGHSPTGEPDSQLLFTLDHPGITSILRALFNTIHGLAPQVRGGW